MTQRHQDCDELVTELHHETVSGYLCDAHLCSAELERTFVCRFRFRVSHVPRPRHLADSNVLVGGLRLQTQKSHVQMT